MKKSERKKYEQKIYKKIIMDEEKEYRWRRLI